MKLLRLGNKGQEFVAALDNNDKLRNLSKHLKDLNPDTISFETLKKLESINLESLPEVDQNLRVGSCIARPGDFLAIGLNYKAHVEGTNSKLPDEPILFNKSTGSILGPNDSIEKPLTAKKFTSSLYLFNIYSEKIKKSFATIISSSK